MAERRRCKAMLTDGSRRCRNAPIRGGTVCRYHGGAAPQVRAAARDRLHAMANEAVDALQRALAHNDMRSAVRAAELVLDRAGCAPVTDLESFFREHAPRIAEVIGAVLHRFGLDVKDAMVRTIVRGEVQRVAGVEVLDAESVKVGYVSAQTRERIASELRGEVVEPDTVVM